jgi:hypothetical protein
MEDSKIKLEKVEIILQEILKSINVNKLIEFEENDFIDTYYPRMLLLKTWLLLFINHEEVVPIEEEITFDFYLKKRKLIKCKLEELYKDIKYYFFDNYSEISTEIRKDEFKKLYKIYTSYKKMNNKRR